MRNSSFQWLRFLPSLAFLACLTSCKREKAVPEQPRLVERSVADRIENDKTKIFQQAFWRKPDEDDRIIHAERREWIEGTAVKGWQWFLVLKPSEELVEELRVKNRFNLHEEHSGLRTWENAPEWFWPQLAGSTILSSGDGEMSLIFQGEELFATGTGGGFRSGSEAPLPKRQPSPEEQSGRLPNYSPPSVK